jgi:hypothetical protein
MTNENSLITCVELERHWNYKQLKFVCTWVVETYGHFANLDAKLLISKKQLHSLYKARNKIIDALDSAHCDMHKINGMSKAGIRDKVQSLAIECKWSIFKYLKDGAYYTQDTLNTIPREMQLFLRTPVFLE